MIRNTCLQKFGLFDPETETLEDWDLCLRFALKYRIGVIKEILVRYRVHRGQSPMETSINGRIKTSMKHLNLVNSQLGFPYLSRICYNFYIHLANAYYIDSKPKFFRKFLYKALKLNPLALFQSRLSIHLLMSIIPASLNRKMQFFKNRYKK